MCLYLHLFTLIPNIWISLWNNSLSIGQCRAAGTLSSWRPSAFSFRGLQEPEKPFISLAPNPLPWWRICCPDLQIPWSMLNVCPYFVPTKQVVCVIYFSFFFFPELSEDLVKRFERANSFCGLLSGPWSPLPTGPGGVFLCLLLGPKELSITGFVLHDNAYKHKRCNF